METFRIGDALSFGWEKFKKHFLFLWLILGSAWLLSYLSSLLQKGAGKETLLGGLISIASIVIGIIVDLGLIRMYLDLADGKEGKLENIFSQYRLFWNYLGAAILYGLMLALGFVLLIIPGIYLGLKYQFFSYLIVDKNLGVMDAFKKSAAMTEGVKWQLFGFCLVIFGVNLLGAIALVFGLLVTVPMSIMAYVYVYRTLCDRANVVSLGEVTAPMVTPVATSTVTPAPPVLVASVPSEEK